jgi:hypothetical protein
VPTTIGESFVIRPNSTRFLLGAVALACSASLSLFPVASSAAEAAATPGIVTGVAGTSDIQFQQDIDGMTPFIRYARFTGSSLSAVTMVSYTIAAKPGATARPVKVQYSIAALQRRGFAPQGGPLTLPVFGLYSNTTNSVTVAFDLSDGTRQQMVLSMKARKYVDPNHVYDSPTIITPRDPNVYIGWNYMFMKSGIASPVIVDTDAQVRWVGGNVESSFSSILNDGGFVIGEHDRGYVQRMEMDGTVTETQVDDPSILDFNHDISFGRDALLAGVDIMKNGVVNTQSTIVEMTPVGHIIRTWDFAQILTDYMTAHGDNAALFVRPPANWFHANSALYDPSDNSLIVSSREQFVIKVDYDTQAIKWIFGDPTKFWYTFPSLRALGVTLTNSKFYPIGQHRVTFSSTGALELFNNGFQSANMPKGDPAGRSRPYSAVNAYTIDPVQFTAREVYRYDHGQTLKSKVCGSAYESYSHSQLIDFPAADNGTHAHIVGLDGNQNVAFEYQYNNKSCATAWNTIMFPFENFQILD